MAPEHLRLLHEAALDFNSTLELDELLPRVFERVLADLEAESGSIWLRQGDMLVCKLARGPVADRIEGLELPWGAGIVGDVGRRGVPELVEDAADDDRFVFQVDEATGYTTRSVVAAPLVAKGEVLGVLQLINRRSGDGRFDERHRDLLAALGSTAGLAVRNARLMQVEQRARDLQALLEISREITSTLDTDRLILSVVNLASQAIAYDRAAVALDEVGRPVVRAISGVERIDRKAEDTRQLEALITWLAEHGEMVVVEDVEADDGESRALRKTFGAYLDRRGIRSLCLVPLADQQGRLGSFYMESSSPRLLGVGGLEATQLLANQVSVALRNAELYGQTPFIGFLQPIAGWRARLNSMSRQHFLVRYALPLLGVLAVASVPWAQRTTATRAELLPAGRMPVRATVGGLVIEVPVVEGEEVRDGTLLARLRDDDLELRLHEAQAGFAAATRQAAAARARGDESGARLAEIKADELSSRVDLFSDQVSRTSLTAPRSGVVLTMRPWEKLGEWLPAGEVFVVLGHTDQLELEARIPQRHVDRTRPGQEVRLKVEALPEHTFVARVSEIGSQARPGIGPSDEPEFVVRARIDNSERLLRPGMQARVKVIGDRRPIGWILVRPLVEWVQLRFWR
jgi:GAF domain-containing protein/multidrug efflux pump subunit AcrA (membrane-fusion protein)